MLIAQLCNVIFAGEDGHVIFAHNLMIIKGKKAKTTLQQIPPPVNGAPPRGFAAPLEATRLAPDRLYRMTTKLALTGRWRGVRAWASLPSKYESNYGLRYDGEKTFR